MWQQHRRCQFVFFFRATCGRCSAPIVRSACLDNEGSPRCQWQPGCRQVREMWWEVGWDPLRSLPTLYGGGTPPPHIILINSLFETWSNLSYENPISLILYLNLVQSTMRIYHKQLTFPWNFKLLWRSHDVFSNFVSIQHSRRLFNFIYRRYIIFICHLYITTIILKLIYE